MNKNECHLCVKSCGCCITVETLQAQNKILRDALEGYAIVPGKSSKPAKQALNQVDEME